MSSNDYINNTIDNCLIAAENGNKIAQYNLGDFYRNGIGIEKDIKKAIHWYQKAAENDNENDYANLVKDLQHKKDKDKNYGVLPYIAPEVLRCKPYTPASVIYSFSMIMWEFTSVIPPFNLMKTFKRPTIIDLENIISRC
ncbi:hypothetical protein C1645_818504 [Glomus cerebriforme]|uniref:Protein kinase domain-containing protein n=1 Tax=Glomus cerebriforme TaxID=658196 RepID=A0A397T9U9_9GLOM|nr:hypothetical protein C1645_818504 [Glomus cerebriforme]